MVSVTLALPEEIRKAMKKHDEINWSGFIRKSIIKKTKELEEKERILKELEKEKEMIDWSVKLQRKSRSGRFEELRKKGLV